VKVAGVMKFQKFYWLMMTTRFYIDDDHHHLYSLITITMISFADFITLILFFHPHTHYDITVSDSCLYYKVTNGSVKVAMVQFLDGPFPWYQTSENL
jgi:hypothetical protein